MPEATVTIRGLDSLRRKLGASDGQMAQAVREGLLAGAAIVNTASQRKVHSPDHPFVGKAGYSVATGKLQASLGIGNVEGSGFGQSIRVGHPHGNPGGEGATFARSRDSGRRTRSGNIIPTRTGGRFATSKGRANKADVRVYGRVEERKHPFLKPSLVDNRMAVVRAIADRIRAVIARFG